MLIRTAPSLSNEENVSEYKEIKNDYIQPQQLGFMLFLPSLWSRHIYEHVQQKL